MAMNPSAVPVFNLNRKFLSDEADVSLQLSSPAAPALLAALRSETATIPPGELTLGTAKASASAEVPVRFGEPGRQVTFSGEGEASFAVGVYVDGADAVKAIAPSEELAAGLELADPAATRYMVVRAAYDLSAAANGAVALSAGMSATFGVSGASQGLFAVLHRFADAEPALQVFRETFASWALPRQVDDADDLAPGTWLVAEVDGSVALRLGVQAGYDFSWLREIPGGALQGDIGLRVQLGARAALGIDVSGKYAVVLARESADPVLRLRLYKMTKKGWNFALDARVGIDATLPPFFDQPHKAEDLVAAIFGLNENQIIDALRETRAFVNSNVALKDKLAGVLLDLGGVAVEKASGMTEAELRTAYESGRQVLLTWLGKFDDLTKSGGHELTSMLLSLTGADFGPLLTVLRDIATSGGEPEVQSLVRDLVSKAGFEQTPIARFIEAGVGPALGVLTNTSVAKQLQAIAGQAVGVLEGGTLDKLLGFIRERVAFERVLAVANAADFDTLDNLLKSRLAAFLGKQEVLLSDLTKIQEAVRSVLANVDKFYDLALQAAKQTQEFAFTARYTRSTMRTALLDISFDLTKRGTTALLRQAVRGDFSDLLLEAKDGVTLHAAELTHNVTRTVSSELMLPFGVITDSARTLSSAKLTIVEDNGRVLVYSLDASDEASQRKTLFGARSGRDSTLTIAATMPLAAGPAVRVWNESSFGYSYRMQRAVERMRQPQFLEEVGPLVEKYAGSSFPTSGATFSEWTSDLDKLLDGKDPHSGTHDIGDTLITLTLSAPPAYLRAWTKAPVDRKNPVYMKLSLALQAKLKELVTFYYFSDAARYEDLEAAAAAIVYSCIPISTTVRMAGGKVTRFNTDEDLHWDVADIAQIRAIAGASQTVNALGRRMESIAATLRGIPSLAHSAQFYAPDQKDEVIAAALRREAASSPVPERLGSLLFLEAQLVDNAVRIGTEMARFRQAAGVRPAEALKHLAAFGEAMAGTFNRTLGSHPFLSGASRPLGTLLFLEACTQFDPDLAQTAPAAMLDIKVVQSGKLSIETLLAGAVPAEIVLHEQRFIEA